MRTHSEPRSCSTSTDAMNVLARATRPPRAVLTFMPSLCVTWFEFDLHHRVAPSHDRAIADDPLSTGEGVIAHPKPAVRCLHGRQPMEHLWNVMKKGLLSGDTLR